MACDTFKFSKLNIKFILILLISIILYLDDLFDGFKSFVFYFIVVINGIFILEIKEFLLENKTKDKQY